MTRISSKIIGISDIFFSITNLAGDNGSITPSSVVRPGATVTVHITPNVGFDVQQVTLNGVNQGAVTSLVLSNIYQNYIISATFVIRTYTVSLNLTNAQQSGAPSVVNHGERFMATFTATATHRIPSSVSVSGATGSYNSSTGVLTVTNAVGNVIITATGVERPMFEVVGFREAYTDLYLENNGAWSGINSWASMGHFMEGTEIVVRWNHNRADVTNWFTYRSSLFVNNVRVGCTGGQNHWSTFRFIITGRTELICRITSNTSC